MPGEITSLMVTLPENNISLDDATDHLEMFMPNMRFVSGTITYKFDADCSPGKQKRVYNAFNIISEATKIIKFQQSFSDAQINIYCNESKKEIEKNMFIAGEGGPLKVTNSTLYPLIGGGQIYLYDTQKQNQCEYPVVEIHEMMHVFGFNHIKEKTSILYPYLDCDQRLDSEIVDELIKIYSVEAKAELKIVQANISKSGAYLDFDIGVENIGLIDGKNVRLEVKTADDTKIKGFILSDVEPGTTQTISVHNLKLPSRGVNEIHVEITSDSKEYFTENNFLTAKL